MDNAIDSYTAVEASLLTREKNRSGLSFTKLADRTGSARATIVRVLGGERPVTTHYLHELGIALGVTPGALLSEADELEAAGADLTAASVAIVALAASDDPDWQRRQEEGKAADEYDKAARGAEVEPTDEQ